MKIRLKRPLRAGSVLTLGLVAIAQCGNAETTLQGASSAEYEVLLRRDAAGVAHIEAADYGSLGYGEGYAAAEDHLCNIAY